MALVIHSCLLQQPAGIIVRRTESVSTFTGWLKQYHSYLGIERRSGLDGNYFVVINPTYYSAYPCL